MLCFRPHWIRLSLLAALLTIASGCWSGSARKVVIGKVSGKVTLDGEPVKAGSVLTFIPKSAGAEIGSALIRDGGIYVATSGEFPGIPVGEYRVVVLPPRMDPKEEEELAKKNFQITMNALVTANKKELAKVEYPQDAIVPKKYWTESTSELTCTVAEGENTADFELSSKKRSSSTKQ